MKRFLFILVSALIAGIGYCSSLGEKLIAKATGNTTQIEQQQEQSLVLEQPSVEFNKLSYHVSHSSHRSHSSHSSHRSHSSHYSSW